MNNKWLWCGEAFNQKLNHEQNNFVCIFFNVNFATTIKSFVKYMPRLALSLQRN